MTALDAVAGPWSARYRTTTIGVFALAFLVAFESLAVTTVMPVVADDLDGLRVYGLAFAMPMAVSVFGLTLAGPWMDNRGPAQPMRLGVGVFAMGLVVAGLAQSMTVFLVGRAVQGFGAGLVGVGLYVMIAKLYPVALRARVFTVLSSAWVLPGIVGPGIAGTIAHVVGWRWLFLGVPLLAVAALGMLWRAVGTIESEAVHTAVHTSEGRRRVWWALSVSAGVLVISVAGQRDFTGWQPALVSGIAVVIAFGSRLLPKGTWLLHRGLPGVIALRGITSAAFFSAEVYVPLSLVNRHGLSPALAGGALTFAAIAWFGGSWLAANVTLFHDKPRRARLGILAVTIGVGLSAVTLVDGIPVFVTIIGWSIAGLGMGMATSTLSVLMLDHSAPGQEGTSSSALQVNDAIMQAVSLSVGSAAFAALLDHHSMLGYLINFGGAFALGVLATLAAPRLLKPS